MTRQLQIITAGPHASVQDFGRCGFQSLGVPEGGVLDRGAMRLANRLVGNREDAAVIEVCLGGLTIMLTAPARVALTGTKNGVLTIQNDESVNAAQMPMLEVPANRSVTLGAGRIIRLGITADTNTAVIAISGGVVMPMLYGSAATSPTAMIGGMEGRLLRDGDILPLGDNNNGDMELNPELAVDVGDMFSNPEQLRVVMGPQDDRFPEKTLKTFLTSEFKVTLALNRMGMRLDGATLNHLENADILSDGIVTGTVQVPGDGNPIILMADHQTTGGYTKIATVISTDLPALSRLRPGCGVRFNAVTVAEAEALAHASEAAMLALFAKIKPASALMDTGALYQLGDTT